MLLLLPQTGHAAVAQLQGKLEAVQAQLEERAAGLDGALQVKQVRPAASCASGEQSHAAACWASPCTAGKAPWNGGVACVQMRDAVATVGQEVRALERRLGVLQQALLARARKHVLAGKHALPGGEGDESWRL